MLETLGNATPNFRARNADLGHLDRWRRINSFALTAQIGQGGQNPPAALPTDGPPPARPITDLPGSANAAGRGACRPPTRKTTPVGVFLAKMVQRLGCVVYPAAIGFVPADGHRFVAGNGQFEHFNAKRGRGRQAILLMRRDRRRQEPDGVQPALFPTAFGQQAGARNAPDRRFRRTARAASSCLPP